MAIIDKINNDQIAELAVGSPTDSYYANSNSILENAGSVVVLFLLSPDVDCTCTSMTCVECKYWQDYHVSSTVHERALDSPTLPAKPAAAKPAAAKPAAAKPTVAAQTTTATATATATTTTTATPAPTIACR